MAAPRGAVVVTRAGRREGGYARSIPRQGGQAPAMLWRDEFRRRYLAAFVDPAFDAERTGIDRLETIAYDDRPAPSDCWRFVQSSHPAIDSAPR